MTQTNHLYDVKISDFIRIFDEWLSRKHLFYWSKDPEWVRTNMILNSANGKIRYDHFVKIMDAARTSKMPGHANKGLEYIKQECKKLRIRNDEPNAALKGDFKVLKKFLISK